MEEILAQSRPDSPSSYLARGIAFAEISAWDRADGDFQRVISLDAQGFMAWYQHALVRLAKDDGPGYRAACAQMLKRFANTQDAQTADFVAWTCCLGSQAISDMAPAIALAERAVRAEPQNGKYLQTLGAILYRAGRLDESIQKLEQAERLLPEHSVLMSPAYTRFLLATAEEKRRHHEKAQEWLALAREAMNDQFHPPIATWQRVDWKRRLTLTIFGKEAESLVESGGSASTKQ
jgi:tetratricopeptide (TPR) repeat protein